MDPAGILSICGPYSTPCLWGFSRSLPKGLSAVKSEAGPLRLQTGSGALSAAAMLLYYQGLEAKAASRVVAKRYAN